MSERLPRISGRELLSVLERSGWLRTRQAGSHIQLKHPDRSGRVTIAAHGAEILKPKTLLTILSQADLTVDEHRDLL